MTSQNQILHAVNQCEEDMYPMSVALGYVASQVLVSARDRKAMQHLVRISRESIKWSDSLDFVKARLVRYSTWRISIPNASAQIASYGTNGFGHLFLRVAEQYFLPMFTRVTREQGYHIASKDMAEATQAHTIILRLFKKMVSQMFIEYQYRLSVPSARYPAI